MSTDVNVILYHDKQKEIFGKWERQHVLCRCIACTKASAPDPPPVWQRTSYVTRRTSHNHCALAAELAARNTKSSFAVPSSGYSSCLPCCSLQHCNTEHSMQGCIPRPAPGLASRSPWLLVILHSFLPCRLPQVLAECPTECSDDVPQAQGRCYEPSATRPPRQQTV